MPASSGFFRVRNRNRVMVTAINPGQPLCFSGLAGDFLRPPPWHGLVVASKLFIAVIGMGIGSAAVVGLFWRVPPPRE